MPEPLLVRVMLSSLFPLARWLVIVAARSAGSFGCSALAFAVYPIVPLAGVFVWLAHLSATLAFAELGRLIAGCGANMALGSAPWRCYIRATVGGTVGQVLRWLVLRCSANVGKMAVMTSVCWLCSHCPVIMAWPVALTPYALFAGYWLLSTLWAWVADRACTRAGWDGPLAH